MITTQLYTGIFAIIIYNNHNFKVTYVTVERKTAKLEHDYVVGNNMYPFKMKE